MEDKRTEINTPGGIESTSAPGGVSGPLESGEPTLTCYEDESERPGTGNHKIRHKQKNYFATLNINSLLKTGKLKHLTDTLTQNKILLTAIQETRYTDEHAFDSQGYRILKGKIGRRRMKNVPHLGTGFIVSHKMLDSVIEFSSPNSRVSLLTFRCSNKIYTVVNVHAPINEDNKRNPENTDTFWEELEDVISKVPERHTIILLGDFNAQLGKERKYKHIVGEYPAHLRTNRNGERLVGLCRAFNLVMKSTAFKRLPRKQKTWTSPNNLLGEFQIDHVAISRKSHREIQNVRVLRGANLDSDHYLSKIKLKFLPRNTKKTKSMKLTKFDLEKLSTCNQFTDKLEALDCSNWDELKNNLVKVATETAPFVKQKKHAWWTTMCEEAVAQRQIAWLKWNSQKTPLNRDKFIEQRKSTTRIIRQVKRQFTKDQLTQLDEDFKKNNSRNFYKSFKRNLSRYNPPSLHFRGPDGKMAYNDIDNCNLLAKYFENLLNCKPPNTFFTYKDTIKQPNSEPPSKEEVIKIIQSLKNNKASGEDAIVAELWKHAGDRAVSKLTEILHNIWETETLPNDWTSALIHPLHKKGDISDINNYRGISLIPVTYKILSKALLSRAEPQLDPQLGEYQGGFRKGRSCAEQILNLKSVLRQVKMAGKKFVVIFVDFKKAYDSVDRPTLIKILQELGLDQKTLNLIQQTLNNTTSRVKFRGTISKSFEIKTGVRQGDGLSPLLFNCALEKVIREWRKKIARQGIPSGIYLGHKRDGLMVDCLAFADDLALLSDSIETSVKQLNILGQEAAKIGLQVSFEKTQYITNISESPHVLLLEQGRVKKTNKFKYLGEWLEPNLSEGTALSTRINKLELAYQLTKNTYNKRCLSRNIKMKHYQTVIRPEALYASECLILNRKGLTDKLEIQERKIMRKILGPVKEGNEYKKRPNQELYRHTEKITDVARKRRLAFYGHVSRMHPTRMTNQLLTYWQRRKTKSPWLTEVHKDLLELGVTDRDTKDRTSMRIKLKQIKFQDKPPRKKKGALWTKERKQQHSQRMRDYWANIKTHSNKK